MNNDLISRKALREKVNAFYDSHFKGLVPKELITYAEAVDDLIDNAPTVNEVRVIDTNAENNSENALLMDIAHSLAIIADNSMKEGNTQESGNEILRWVHSEAHRVMCPKCGCRVSMTAAYEMNYCFKCGERLGGIKNDNS